MLLHFQGSMAHKFNGLGIVKTEIRYGQKECEIGFHSGHSLLMTFDEASTILQTLKEMCGEYKDEELTDDDLDEIADHDQQIWDIRETAKELTLHLLRQSDMPSVMNDDAFATSIAQRAVFLAKAMHAKLTARKD